MAIANARGFPGVTWVNHKPLHARFSTGEAKRSLKETPNQIVAFDNLWLFIKMVVAGRCEAGRYFPCLFMTKFTGSIEGTR